MNSINDYKSFVERHGKNFCALPFTEIANTAQGHTMLCCYSETIDSNVYPTQGFLEGWKNSKGVNRARKNMLNDKSTKHCRRCYEYENSGAYNMSKRYAVTSKYEREQPDLIKKIKSTGHLELKTLDLKFGNKCNLACIMCDGHSSSLHIKEKEQHKVPPQLKKHIPDNAHYQDFTKEQLEELLSTAHTLKKVKFTGGEPTLLEGFREFVNRLSQTEYAKNISIMMVTNGTTDLIKMIPIMSKFNNFEVHWSTDGIGSTFEYIRWPAKWDKVKGNQIKFNASIKQHKSIKSILTSAIQLLNIDQLPALIKYTNDNNFDEFIPVLVMWPTPLDLSIVPTSIKQNIINKILPLIKDSTKFNFVLEFIELIKTRSAIETFSSTKDFLAYYDTARGYSAKEMCPIINEIQNTIDSTYKDTLF